MSGEKGEKSEKVKNKKRKNMNSSKNIILAVLHLSLMAVLVSCEKVSPIGVLVAGTGVEDRVKMSSQYFKEYMADLRSLPARGEEYTFLVGADSHVTTDLGRIDEMFQIGLDNDDLLYAHLGDIADTKAEYYINLSKSIEKAKMAYAEKYYDFVEIEDEKTDQHLTCFIDPATGERYMDVTDVPLPFYPVVGNHDITHNGWALWSSLFHSSFYRVFVLVEQADGQWILDRYFFLDTASGTLGREQVKLIEEDLLEGKELEQHNIRIRHTFVFSHTNIFRPSSMQFASTFPREETFFLLNQFKEWNASIVFCGHVHRWDEQEVGGVHYLTLDSMSEHNNPDAGDYLVRVHVKKDGTLSWERVRMNHVAKK